MSIQAAKLRCCGENYTVLRQNGLFECNQKRLFEELEGNEKYSDVICQLKKSAKISGVEFGKKKHNAEAECLQDLKNELDALGRQGEVKVSAPMIKKQLREKKIVPSWKYAGPDGMHGYWLKKFTVLHV